MGRAMQRGQAIILIAVMLGVVVGMAALAIDGSRAYALRRDMQNAVDYAALAAADAYQRSPAYAGAESTAATAFGIQMRLYAAPSCGAFGSPGPGTFTVTCTYSDGTTLLMSVPVIGPRGNQISLTASRTLALQFGRILTNGTSPTITASAAGRVNNLLYAPTVAALDQAGCGGAGGTAIAVSGSGVLKLTGDMVANGAISVSSGSSTVAGDVYARCQGSVSGVTPVCYPSGANPACTYPDVAGAFRSGQRLADPKYPTPGPIGGSQAAPGNNVVLLPGAYTSLATFASSRCYFLAGGVYSFQAGFLNVDALVSNELKPPDEPLATNNKLPAAAQFWDTSGTGCAGSVQPTAVQCTGNNNCGVGNCGNGQGNGQGNGCASAPAGDWSIEVTSTRTDTFNGSSYVRESAPSMCRVVHVGNNQAIQVIVSNVPGATAYYVYAAYNNTCNGPFGLADILPVSVPVLNNALSACPAFTGSSCSLGYELITLNGNDIGPPWAPNGAAPPDTTGAPPPNPELSPVAAGHPNQNPGRGAGAAGDRANENNCENTAGSFVTCPSTVTPGAVAIYLPAPSCFVTANTSDTFLFSGYQYNWVVAYEPAANTCFNFYGANQNSALVGLTYMPGASFNVIDGDTFDVTGTGGVIADIVTFTGSLPAIAYSSAYAPVPFAARLVS